MCSLRADYVGAMEWFRKSLEASLQDGGMSSRPHAMLNMGRIFVRMRDYPTALGYMAEALAMAENMGDPETLAKVLDAIGTVHVQLGDGKVAREYYERSYGLFQECDLEIPAALTLTNIGVACVALDETDEALGHIREALAVFRRCRIPYYLARTLMILGDVQCERGDYRAALEALRESVAVSQSIGNRLGEATALLYNVKAHLGLDEVDCAAEYAGKGIAIAEELNDGALMYNFYDMLATICERMGDPLLSVRYLRMRIALKEKIEGMQAQRAAVMLQMQGEVDRMRAELERYREKSRTIEREMEAGRQELASVTLKLTRRDEREEKLEGRLRSYAEHSTGDVAEALRGMLADLKQMKNEEKRWRAFERQFEYLLPGFLQRLSSTHPALTPTELKVCSLVRINLATKDIASILCTSARTIDNHRRHIRVKMSLSPRANLTTVLLSFE
jgi:tetratricopeptide (TPR) repeat protein/DNA-binding CsgD family transcriptional regulator